MKRAIPLEKLGGVWSAAPTPLTDRMEIDVGSVGRMVDHHVRLGIHGLFLAGTNGEGPWLPDGQRRELVRAVAKRAAGRLVLAVQVTDNSASRILDNMQAAREDGADIAVIAPPYFSIAGHPDLRALYTEAIRGSPLPVGIYDRGKHGPTFVADAVLRALYMERNVIMVKDSSMDPTRRGIALACRRKRRNLRLLSGWEFNCVEYLRAGYDGLLLGGGVFNGYIAGQIIEAVRKGDIARADRLQTRMNRIMYAVYGGKKIRCWLAGEKELLVEMGILRTWRNYPGYCLNAACARAIRRVIERDMDVLMPGGAV